MIALLFVGGFIFVLTVALIISCIDWINREFAKRQMRDMEPMNYFQQRVYGDDEMVKKPRRSYTKDMRQQVVLFALLHDADTAINRFGYLGITRRDIRRWIRQQQ